MEESDETAVNGLGGHIKQSKLLQPKVPWHTATICQLLSPFVRKLNQRKQERSAGNEAAITPLCRHLCFCRGGTQRAAPYPDSSHWSAGHRAAAWTRLCRGADSGWNPQSPDPYSAGSWSHQTRKLHQTELWHHLQIHTSVQGILLNEFEEQILSFHSLEVWYWVCFLPVITTECGN